jgi:hypothetical protein
MFNKLSLRHFTALLLCAGVSVASQAAPPRFIGYTGKPWVNDYGVLSGECNTKETQKQTGTMAVLEADEVVQMNLPPAINSLTLSTTDALCFGHTLELVPAGQFVRWISPNSGVGIYVAPYAKSESCRTYLGVVVQNGQKTKFRGEACTKMQGVWKVQPPSQP